MVNKDKLIDKYSNSEDYLAELFIIKIVLYQINFEDNYVFGATITKKGDKIYFLRQLDLDEHGYIFFSLHGFKYYRKDFQFLREPPSLPHGHEGKIKNN